jgi:hypothetical protein
MNLPFKENMKTHFIMTSAINVDSGVFSPEQRLEQTIGTVMSIVEYAPGSSILICDNTPITSEMVNSIFSAVPKCDITVCYVTDKHTQSMNGIKRQTLAEFSILNQNFSANGADRIFKISGRYQLTPEFKLSDYESVGDNFVFKKRRVSWIGDGSELLETRLWSVGARNVGLALKLIYDSSVFSALTSRDMEHSIMANIDQNYLTEFDMVHCKGVLASTGEERHD